MRQKIFAIISIAASLVLILSACSGGTQPTPDASAISTAAAQTVEARFTQQAAASTATPLPPTETPIPQPTATQAATATNTPSAGQPAGGNTGKPCLTMTFVADVSIPDGMIVAPGTTFTKTWRVRNDGSCVWDQNYTLVFDKGDNFSTGARFPLSKKVYPGDSIDLSIPMSAPTAEGDYAGYWHILTAFGGPMGVGSYNQDLTVQIKVTSKPDRDFGIASVVYDWTREPHKGCGSDGAVYTFTATITANSPGEINYRWDSNPVRGETAGGVLKWTEAGAKTVFFTWTMTNGHIQNIDRTVWITTVIGIRETAWDRVMFNFTCAK